MPGRRRTHPQRSPCPAHVRSRARGPALDADFGPVPRQAVGDQLSGICRGNGGTKNARCMGAPASRRCVGQRRLTNQVRRHRWARLLALRTRISHGAYRVGHCRSDDMPHAISHTRAARWSADWPEARPATCSLRRRRSRRACDMPVRLRSAATLWPLSRTRPGSSHTCG
jgi:hypothetical protein